MIDNLKKILKKDATKSYLLGPAVFAPIYLASYLILESISYINIIFISTYTVLYVISILSINTLYFKGKIGTKKWQIYILFFLGIPASFFYSYFIANHPDLFSIAFFVILGGFIPLMSVGVSKHFVNYFTLSFIITYVFFLYIFNENVSLSFIFINSINIIILVILAQALLKISSYISFVNNGIQRSKAIEKKSRNTIAKEKAISEKLLQNILPKEIADELTKTGSSIPKSYKSVTVMFTDFSGFTKIVNELEAEKLVEELDKCFSYFDSVTKKYKLEKIKTIGDSYMICAGIPIENKTHPVDSILAAMEIQSFMNQMKEIKQAQNIPYWELRLGVNTGPLIAGVIGEMKFSYDVFGDTVNTASRMESTGIVGKINISKNTYKFVHEFFDCEYRGKLPAKNKGLIDMYFVNGIKKELSLNEEKRVPNKLFHEKYSELEKLA
ncbi:MAG: adenylate/guanylate cyclase domain-containing protein [Leptospiraceae bacterium]|nr:adenylate/guanylate cyclase domain-containing protein [Leptospiraceae bacterium]